MSKSQVQRGSERPLEYCHVCDEPTGRAGQGDGSLYCECDRGPFCEECWDKHHIVDTKVSKLEAELSADRDKYLTRIVQLEEQLATAQAELEEWRDGDNWRVHLKAFLEHGNCPFCFLDDEGIWIGGHKKGCLLGDSEQQLTTAQDEVARLREYYKAHIEVETQTVSFTLHKEAVERLEKAKQALEAGE